MYGQCIQLVLAFGLRVNIYAYDFLVGEFILTHHRIKFPQKTGIYSIDHGKEMIWERHVKTYIKRKI
jgi:fructose-1,6-bisphosphatase I